MNQTCLANKIWIPKDFNEELPVYILDTGESFMILFGQWMYDPHTLVASEDELEKRELTSFFNNFSIEFGENGDVVRMKLEKPTTINAEILKNDIRFKRLAECQIIKKISGDLIKDLRDAEFIY